MRNHSVSQNYGISSIFLDNDFFGIYILFLFDLFLSKTIVTYFRNLYTNSH